MAQISNIKQFPSEKAQQIQDSLKELSPEQLKQQFLANLNNNLGKPNSLANWMLKHWDEEKGGSKLYIEWTGIEVYSDKETIKATDVSLKDISCSNAKYFLWKCKGCGHEWVARISNRTNVCKTGCPACKQNPNTLIPGVNDFYTYCKQQGSYGEQLLEEFLGIDEKGNTIKPTEIAKSSHTKVKWKCKVCKYEWPSDLNHRTSNNRGCPSCGNKRSAQAVRDNGEKLPDYCKRIGDYTLKKEFMGLDIDRNPIKFEETSRASGDLVWWKCSNPNCRYEWHTTPAARTSSYHTGCPACNEHPNTLIQGVNDFKTWCDNNGSRGEQLLKEFTGKDEYGSIIKPTEISKGNGKIKVGWCCQTCKHTWYKSLAERTRTDRYLNCPKCNKIGTSFPEQYIYQSLKQLFSKTDNRAKTATDEHFEYDIVIPELNLCIEYSGINWHKDKLQRDEAKATLCKKYNLNFLQIYAHNGQILDEFGLTAPDSYNKEQIIYLVDNDKQKHISQLQYIVKFILEQYSCKEKFKQIDFNKSEQEANRVMGKATTGEEEASPEEAKS